MSYQELYQKKLTTAQEAVKVVKSGDWVDYTWATSVPVALDKALAARKDELTDVRSGAASACGCRRSARQRTLGTTLPGTPGIAAVSTARSSPRAWVTSLRSAILSCPVSTGSIWTPWMW